MKRIVMAIAATAAVVPAALGLLGNESFAQSLPTAVPASVQLVSSSSSTPAGTADDNGGDRTTRTAEPGDDHGGDRTTRTAELWLGLWLRLGRQLGLGFGFLGRRQR